MVVRLTTTDLSFVRPNWTAASSVKVFSSTRLGGVSRDSSEQLNSRFNSQSLNLAMHVQDEPEHVLQNRQRVSDALAFPSEPVWLQQVHGVEIITLTDQLFETPPTADGIITQSPGRVLTIMTADCLPILISNTQGTEIAALHAGWRSLAGGIIERAIARMESSPEDLIAWGGPCIGPDSFEVGGEVLEQLGGAESAYRPSENKGKYYANLYQLAGQRLEHSGVINYTHANTCTLKQPERFFSHRRSIQQTGKDCGRMATFIWITG